MNNRACPRYYEFNKVNYKAVCMLRGNDIKGVIHFEQLQNDIVVVFGVILGLTEGFHGINVHEFGDACGNELGEHYNPEKSSHGSPSDVHRHVGDLGNIHASKYGVSYVHIIDGKITLTGDRSIIGRSLAVHEREDDLGRGPNVDSSIHGNSGNVIAWGIIGVA
ncbi:gp131R [Rabbit fibroma virus]|uniref:Gp131R n=1 Tax=Rabbit fibroma virus (strain Kasza) TaxID=10272 RepID=Q9Q8U7_RFVKA|nr:gp131R [Rabbit fibroma virus]AAF18014.1 gp131R [Rabbit fibroma virus]